MMDLQPNEPPPPPNEDLHVLTSALYSPQLFPNSQDSLCKSEIIYFPKVAMLKVNIFTHVNREETEAEGSHGLRLVGWMYETEQSVVQQERKQEEFRSRTCWLCNSLLWELIKSSEDRTPAS